MYYRWTFMPAGKQRSRSLALIASRGVHDYTDRDLYTFGVYTGESLKFWLERLAALGANTEDCVEKADLVRRYEETTRGP